MYLSNKETRKASRAWLGKAVGNWTPGLSGRAELVYYRGDEFQFTPWFKRANPLKGGHGWNIISIGDFSENVSFTWIPGSMGGGRNLVVPKKSVLYLSQISVSDIPWEEEQTEISKGKRLTDGALWAVGAMGGLRIFGTSSEAELKAFMEDIAICLAYEREGFKHSLYITVRDRKRRELFEFLSEALGSPPSELPTTSTPPPPTGHPLTIGSKGSVGQ